MDYFEFLAALTQTRDLKWGYFLTFPVLRALPRPRICLCPITAVYFLATRSYIRSPRYEDASRELGLPLSLARRIADAADTIGPYDPQIRQDLVAAVGLGSVL